LWRGRAGDSDLSGRVRTPALPASKRPAWRPALPARSRPAWKLGEFGMMHPRIPALLRCQRGLAGGDFPSPGRSCNEPLPLTEASFCRSSPSPVLVTGVVTSRKKNHSCNALFIKRSGPERKSDQGDATPLRRFNATGLRPSSCFEIVETVRLEPELPPFRFGRDHQFADGVEDHLELRVVFPLHRRELAGEIGMRSQNPAQAHEGAHDFDVDLHGP